MSRNGGDSKPWPNIGLPAGTLKSRHADLVSYIYSQLEFPNDRAPEPKGVAIFESNLGPFRATGRDMITFLRSTGLGNQAACRFLYEPEKDRIRVLLGGEDVRPPFSTKKPVSKEWRPVLEPIAKLFGVSRKDQVRMFRSYTPPPKPHKEVPVAEEVAVEEQPAKVEVAEAEEPEKPSGLQRLFRGDSQLKPKEPISRLELGRTQTPLEKEGITTVAKLLAKLAEGDEAVLAIEGIGATGLENIKAKLKSHKIELPAPVGK